MRGTPGSLQCRSPCIKKNNFFIHSSVDGHLGCLHILVIVNGAAMNNRIHVSLSILVSSGEVKREWDVWKENMETYIQFSSVQSLSRVRLFATPWIAARQASLSITNSWSSLKLNIHWVGDTIQPSHSLSSPSPPAPNPSQHQSLFQWVNSLREMAKVLEFQL